VDRRLTLGLWLLGACLGGCGRLGYEAFAPDDPQEGSPDASRDAGSEGDLLDAQAPDATVLADAAADAHVTTLDAALDAEVMPDASGFDAAGDATMDAAADATVLVDAGDDADDAALDAAVDAEPYGDPPPCNVAVVWQCDFATDPTQLDRDLDGMPDWIVRGGGTFPASEVASGVWTSANSTPLDTNPPHNITTTTYVDVRLRDLRVPVPVTLAYEGALFWVNLDYTATDFIAVFVSVAHVATDVQEVRFYGKSANETTHVLIGPVTVGPDLVRIRMQIDPTTSTLSGWVDGVAVGSAMFPRLTDLNNDHYATAFAASTPAEYDYARVAVCTP